ncbi:MAG TPA: hypothetical protein VKU41_07885 [Polyangiaceae bacterium]|nr:hypothetical protein [Polyangiaceae bacterium]
MTHPYRPAVVSVEESPPRLPFLRGSPGALALGLSLSGPVAFVVFCAIVRGSGFARFLPSTVLYGAIGYALFVVGVLGWARRRR